MEPVTVSGLRYDILNAALKKAVEEIEAGLTTQEAIWLQFELRTAVIHPDAPPEDWYTGSSVVREVSKYIRSARGDREAVRKELHKVNNMRRERY